MAMPRIQDEATIEYEPGCFAYGKVKGYPWWPCVVYNTVEQVPPELRTGQALPKRRPKPSEVVVFWIEPYQFGLVRKGAIKSTSELSQEQVLRECKSQKQRKQLQLAIDALKEMEESEEPRGSAPLHQYASEEEISLSDGDDASRAHTHGKRRETDSLDAELIITFAKRPRSHTPVAMQGGRAPMAAAGANV